jgi:hypothetical protein
MIENQFVLKTKGGFCFAEREAYNEAAANKVWDVFFDMYKRNLG